MPTVDYADSEKPLVGIKSKDGLYTDTGHFADMISRAYENSKLLECSI